jgi:hypothetical protein
MISDENRAFISDFGLDKDSNYELKKKEMSLESDKWYLAPEI